MCVIGRSAGGAGNFTVPENSDGDGSRTLRSRCSVTVCRSPRPEGTSRLRDRLDFTVVYLLTGKVVTAAAFMLVSNIYRTVAYFLHERVWQVSNGHRNIGRTEVIREDSGLNGHYPVNLWIPFCL